MMEELFRKHPLPWTTNHCDAYGAEWEEIIDANEQEVDIPFLVDALNGEQSLNSHDLPEQYTLELVKNIDINKPIQEGINKAFESPVIMPMISGWVSSDRPVPKQLPKIFLDQVKLVNSMSPVLTVDEARGILGYKPLGGYRGNLVVSDCREEDD